MRRRKPSSLKEAAPQPTLARSGAGRSRSVRLSAYYDAAAENREQDWGVRGNHFEDAHFGTGTRNRVLARFRREIRNNPYLAGLVSKYPEAIGTTSLRSRTSSRDYNEDKDLFWFRWAKRCTLDGDSLRTVEKVLGQELLIAGELFVVLVANGRIQLIASEFCASADDNKDPKEVNGIVYAENGRPAFYRFGKLDEQGHLRVKGESEELVDSRYVVHVFDRDRVQMGRGLPWLLPSLRTARDLYEITRAKTKQIKDANSVSGFLEKVNATDFLKSLSGPTGSSDTILDAATGGESGESPAEPSSATAAELVLAPGTFIGLEPGEKANMLSSEYHAEDYKELIMLMLHAIATPVGLPVELWFSGLGEVNFSGFKGLGAQWNARRRHIIGFLEDKFFNRLQFWRISKAHKEGDLPANPDGDEDLVEWGWQSTGILDDERAAKANQIALSTGEASLRDVWESNGRFTEEVLAERRELYIQALIASGQLEEGGDHATVVVPMEFLLRGELPVAAPAAVPGMKPDPQEAGMSGIKPDPQEAGMSGIKPDPQEWHPGDPSTPKG